MTRIINGVLYDTMKSDFICGYNGNYSPKKQRRGFCTNFYIAKNGVIFETHDNDIQLTDEKHVADLKKRMKPALYAKYWPLVIPGESQAMNKKEKKRTVTKKLEEID
jgi:hypothetical protein